MSHILFKVNKAIKNYYNKHGRYPNAILINENDLGVLEYISSHFVVDNGKLEKRVYTICGLKVIPIKYGEMQVVEELK